MLSLLAVFREFVFVFSTYFFLLQQNYLNIRVYRQYALHSIGIEMKPSTREASLFAQMFLSFFSSIRVYRVQCNRIVTSFVEALFALSHLLYQWKNIEIHMMKNYRNSYDGEKNIEIHIMKKKCKIHVMKKGNETHM